MAPLPGAPEDVQYRAWQDVGRSAARWRRRPGIDERSHAACMTDEIITYLEDNALAPTSKVTSADADALGHYDIAAGRMSQLIAGTHRRLDMLTSSESRQSRARRAARRRAAPLRLAV